VNGPLLYALDLPVSLYTSSVIGGRSQIF